MSQKLLPCHCGYQGALSGIDHQGIYLSLACPECEREVTAFTVDGLIEAWNKPQSSKPIFLGVDLASGPDVTIYDCGRCPTSGGCLGCCMKAPATGGE